MKQQSPPGVVVGAAVVVGRGEVVTAASSSVGHQSPSYQRMGRHATFMHDQKKKQQNPPGVVVGAAVVVGRGEVVTAASGSRGRQSHSHQRVGWHVTFLHDTTTTVSSKAHQAWWWAWVRR